MSKTAFEVRVSNWNVGFVKRFTMFVHLFSCLHLFTFFKVHTEHSFNISPFTVNSWVD